MLSLEDITYDKIIRAVVRSEANLISAHPPSGKAYDTPLIRIPAYGRNSGRYHIDLIFEFECILFLVELKGCSSESIKDIDKLRKILGDYSQDELVRLIQNRSEQEGVDWKSIFVTVPAIGVSIHDLDVPPDFVTIIAPVVEEPIQIIVGAAIPNQQVVQDVLSKVF